MQTEYFEVIDDDGKPATARQQRVYGKPGYGYKRRIVAELHCPNGACVRRRWAEQGNDWSDVIVSIRQSNGLLLRVA